MTVAGAQTATAEVSLTRGASLRGQIFIAPPENTNGYGYGKGNGNGYVNGNGNGNRNGNGYVNGNGNGKGNGTVNGGNGANGLGNLLVELRNGEQTLRTVSDRTGAFLFQQLLPGEWTLRVYPHNLPAHHQLETPSRTLHLRPGE